MSAVLTVELAILGGGCAGLSLAQYLAANRQWTKKTLVIEARGAYCHDRSWCFWEPQEERLRQELAPLITHRWRQWQFSGEHFSVLQHDAGRPYCFIPSDGFYQRAERVIASNPCMQLRLGIKVVSVTAESCGYLLTLADGSRVFSSRVIDTRPHAYTSSAQSTLWQLVYGLEVRADRPVFDSSRVGLMHDLTATPTGTQFVYLLPFCAQQALVEWTVFSPLLTAPELMAPQLQAYLQARYPAVSFTVQRTEQAVLPMGLKLTPAQSKNQCRYRYGGQVAGAIRPATGYAFLRIQRWAHACATELLRGHMPRARAQSAWMARTMDALFLDILRRYPQRGAGLFQALAQQVPPAVLVRFLSDEACWLDYLQVIRALPAKLFLMRGHA